MGMINISEATEPNVFQRLTDHNRYTGAHKERFDSNGQGRGLVGREYLYSYTGNTESSNRTNLISNSLVKKSLSPYKADTISTFCTQVVTPRSIFLFGNGRKNDRGVQMYVKSHVRTLEQLYAQCTKEVAISTGPVRRLYDQNLKPVKDIRNLVEGGKYLCCGGEQPDLDRLEIFLDPFVYLK
eukprot:GDKK01042800.1.p1 GENE.GDKK01042800.1~~GDKK01042800.1.p1  ORF type:complete len:183 (-),score=0.86 GDKK01042800.1:92-640(-)